MNYHYRNHLPPIARATDGCVDALVISHLARAGQVRGGFARCPMRAEHSGPGTGAAN